MPAKKAAVATAPVTVITKNSLTTKRFVIRKSLIGTNTVISFENAKKILCTYDHDLVYNAFKSRFDLMTIAPYYIILNRLMSHYLIIGCLVFHYHRF